MASDLRLASKFGPQSKFTHQRTIARQRLQPRRHERWRPCHVQGPQLHLAGEVLVAHREGDPRPVSELGGEGVGLDGPGVEPEQAAQRRKQRVTLAVACALAFALIATIWGGYYLFVQEHKAYFTEFTKRNGFPVGACLATERAAVGMVAGARRSGGSCLGRPRDRPMSSRNAAASSEMDMMFVTAFAGILDLASGELHYVSAGHDRPFLLHDGRGLRQLETEGGPPLGVVEDYLFPVERDRLEGDAVLLLYTDGVTEAQDSGGGLYSSARLSAALPGTAGESAKTVVDFCFDVVGRCVGDA